MSKIAHTLRRSLGRHHGDLPAVLDGFVADVAARTGGGGDHGVEGDRGSSGPSVGGAVVFLAVPAALGGGGLYLTRRGHKHRRKRERAGFEQVRGAVEEDISAYGEKRSQTGSDPSDPASAPDLVDYCGRALDAYETAKARSAAARRPGEGGSRWTIQACAADAMRIDDGREPDARAVSVGGERRRYWDAGPTHGPWAGGYFGEYGSMLLPGLLLETFLGESMTPGYYDAVHYGGGYATGATSEAASVTEAMRALRGRTADDGETGVDRNLSFDT
ncbi:hypothetical protein [Streptomyces sp. Rer75]|uniref:hypothetical protein n=1 Tax=unclassified Streptomyces TaxID=2593676 RepID=UPI0015D036C2|nr:hypothetical protein [Streptomyces sp. Rer75]QLH26366.1 hypothetical protein HYQ63_41895 [Streptomyces sp. Rer75]